MNFSPTYVRVLAESIRSGNPDFNALSVHVDGTARSLPLLEAILDNDTHHFVSKMWVNCVNHTPPSDNDDDDNATAVVTESICAVLDQNPSITEVTLVHPERWPSNTQHDAKRIVNAIQKHSQKLSLRGISSVTPVLEKLLHSIHVPKLVIAVDRLSHCDTLRLCQAISDSEQSQPYNSLELTGLVFNKEIFGALGVDKATALEFTECHLDKGATALYKRLYCQPDHAPPLVIRDLRHSTFAEKYLDLHADILRNLNSAELHIDDAGLSIPDFALLMNALKENKNMSLQKLKLENLSPSKLISFCAMLREQNTITTLSFIKTTPTTTTPIPETMQVRLLNAFAANTSVQTVVCNKTIDLLDEPKQHTLNDRYLTRNKFLASTMMKEEKNILLWPSVYASLAGCEHQADIIFWSCVILGQQQQQRFESTAMQ